MLRIADPGMGMTMQDQGRQGWRRFGVPISGWMDEHAAECANRLLENQGSKPVVEMLLQGAVIEVLRDGWIALCGAALDVNVPTWRAHFARAGDVIRISHVRSGVWSYLAIEGGWEWPGAFGSVSYYERGGIGTRIERGTVLCHLQGNLRLPAGVIGRMAHWQDRRNYDQPPPLKLWKGPQWDYFGRAEQARFLASEWEVSPESDRVGYRLRGPLVRAERPEIASEPVQAGSIQVPGGGEPIVTMQDGPTVGGYPKIALVSRNSLPWLAQCRPGQRVRFEMEHED